MIDMTSTASHASRTSLRVIRVAGFSLNHRNLVRFPQAGQSPLHFAMIKGCADLIPVLLAFGGDLNLRDRVRHGAVDNFLVDATLKDPTLVGSETLVCNLLSPLVQSCRPHHVAHAALYRVSRVHFTLPS